MGRKKIWPPPVRPFRGRDRVRINGEDIYLGPAGSPESKAKYLALITKMEKSDRRFRPAFPTITVGEVIARWLVECDSRYLPNASEKKQMAVSLRAMKAVFGYLPAAEFDDHALEQLQRAMASGSWMTEEEQERNRKNKKPIDVSRNVVNRRIRRVKTMWKWAERQDLVPKGSYHTLALLPSLPKNTPLARHTKPRRGVEWERVERVLPFCSRKVAAMLQLQWWSGMRTGELRMMRLCNIDRSGEVWIYRPEKHKSDWREGATERNIPLGPKCQEILKSWITQMTNEEDYIFIPDPRRGRPYSPEGYAGAIRKGCDRARVERFIPYACRHAAKRRITREFGLDAARAALGQKSLGTTNLYDEQIDMTTAMEVAKKLG